VFTTFNLGLEETVVVHFISNPNAYLGSFQQQRLGQTEEMDADASDQPAQTRLAALRCRIRARRMRSVVLNEPNARRSTSSTALRASARTRRPRLVSLVWISLRCWGCGCRSTRPRRRSPVSIWIIVCGATKHIRAAVSPSGFSALFTCCRYQWSSWTLQRLPGQRCSIPVPGAAPAREPDRNRQRSIIRICSSLWWSPAGGVRLLSLSI
jgi:hypothetical protein